MIEVGFEPTPFRTGALSQRLRPLGQTVLRDRIGMKASKSKRCQTLEVCGVYRFLWLSPVAFVVFRCMFRRFLVAQVFLFSSGLAFGFPLAWGGCAGGLGVSFGLGWGEGWETRPFCSQASKGQQEKGRFPMLLFSTGPSSPV